MSLNPTEISGLAIFGWVKVTSGFSVIDSGRIFDAIAVDFP